MTIEIKKSVKPIKYKSAIDILEDRLEQIKVNKNKELIWILEHEEIYTGGTSFSDNEILDKSINFIKTNRGGKITYHGPGQLVFYFVIDLNKRGKNIKKIITAIEKTIIDTLKNYNIKCFADRKNIGIWFEHKSGKIDKIAAIGIKVKKWIAYHDKQSISLLLCLLLQFYLFYQICAQTKFQYFFYQQNTLYCNFLKYL